MKKIFLTMGLLCAIFIAHAQILNPVHWSYGAKKIGQNEAVVFIKATIDDGWHIYSTVQKDGGPVKTSFAFNTSKGFDLDGCILEPVPVTKYEKVFEMNVLYFENSVVFQQKIKLNTAQALVKGNLKFMVCNDRQCLPPETIAYSIAIN
jgi:hypothetical protein